MKTPKNFANSSSFRSLLCSAIALGMCGASHAQVTYNGNGQTGFGGAVGTGSLTISDSLSGLNITFNRGSGTMDNDLVLYLDTQPGGFANNSTFMDNGDGGREAISGYNAGNPSQTIVNFPTGFAANYAISIENSFIGVFGLASGGNNSLNYLFGQGQSGSDSSPSYSITITPSQMSQIGLTAGSGQTFYFEGTLISETAYRSDEVIGNTATVTSNPGFNGSLTFTSDNAYTLAAVPEPSALALLGGGLLGSLFVLRKRK